MEKIFEEIIRESLAVKKAFFAKNKELTLTAADQLALCLASGRKLLIFGNGGSAADAQHMAAEMVNRYKIERRPLPALALTTDSSIITSIGNDYSFEEIFSKQVLAFGKEHDVAIGISTSGNSTNIINAIKTAKAIGMFTIGLCGRGGGVAAESDLAFCVNSKATARIQEVHITLIHLLCELVERILFPEAF